MNPLQDQVEKLNAMIINGNHAEAIAVFYAEDTQMQENEDEPRRGRDFCVENEKKMLAKVKSVTSHLLNQAIDNQKDIVFSEWQFEFTYPNEQVFRLTEVSVQHWINGLVQKEKFYYKEAISLLPPKKVE
jgi:hypothetical protein